MQQQMMQQQQQQQWQSQQANEGNPENNFSAGPVPGQENAPQQN